MSLRASTDLLASTQLWRLNPSVRLNWRVLDDEWIVFESRSGQTHLLPAHAAAMLMALEAGNLLSDADLLTHLERSLEWSASPKVIKGVVDEFARLGLIVPATSADVAHASV